ncbi:MAG: hypothetical protein ABIL46_06410, partial [candidate division WOR-3 bacterium]
MAPFIFYLINELSILDSSNVHTLFGQLQECIAYNTVIDGIQIVNRALYPGGNLNVHQADGEVSFWAHDIFVYSGQMGSARYPHSIASNPGPHISFSYYFPGPIRGGAGAQFESGGWYSSCWGYPVDIGIGNIGVRLVLGKQLSNGNLIFIICGINNEIYCSIYSYDLTTMLSSGIIGYGNLWGFDINDEVGYVFWYDDSMNILYCRIDTIGISSPDTYDIVLPNPYPLSILGWKQMAVTDAGNPLLVFDVRNGADDTYPYYSKVYVSYAEGESCVAVSSTFGAPDTECFYPTIATGGNLAAVIYSMPRNDLNDSLCWNDIYINWSTDQGITWGTPENLTAQNDSLRLGLQQIAKRLDITRRRAFILCAAGNYDPYWTAFNGLRSGDIGIYFTFNDYTGSKEDKKLKVEDVRLRLEVFPNPF